MMLVTTTDGSISCLDTSTGELFHNRAGAYTEALKNYVEPSDALRILSTTGTLRVLDSCFGLGYNTWVLLSSILESIPAHGTVSILGLELDRQVLRLIPYALPFKRLHPITKQLLPLDIGVRQVSLSNGALVELSIQQGDLRKLVPTLTHKFDLVFHDPFSPKAMPELWTLDLFRQYHRLLRPCYGKLLTYSAAAAVRGGLKEAGFTVWRTAAVGGKSGGTLAALSGYVPLHPDIAYLTEDEHVRIASKSGVPYRDQDFGLPRREILLTRKMEQDVYTTHLNEPT